MDESSFGGGIKGNRGRGIAGKVHLLGTLERSGIVRVEVIKEISARTILNFTARRAGSGSIVYTCTFTSYDSFTFFIW